MTASDAAGGTVATLCLPVSKLSPGNTLHVLSQNTWQYITIMTTHGATGDFGAVGLTTFDLRWRYRLTIYHDVYVCVSLYLQMYSM